MFDLITFLAADDFKKLTAAPSVS